MAFKSIIFGILLAVLLYRVFRLVEFMKFKEAVFNQEPGPCRIVNARKESCVNVNKDSKACDEKAKKGECQSKHDWMAANCAKSCDFCEDPENPILGSEDFADLGGGKVLMSTGVKFKHNHFPERKGQLYLFDFNKPEAGATKVSMQWNKDKLKTLNPHGIGKWTTKGGKVIIFLINHDGNETVERFEYKKNELVHLETIAHPQFTFLNALQPTGERSFYVTNFQRFSKGVLSDLEAYLMLPLGNIAYFDGTDANVVASGYFFPNGLHSSGDNKFLYLANMGDMSIETFTVHDNKSLEHVHTLSINTPVDNIIVDPKTGNLWLGAVPIPWKALLYLDDPKGSPFPPAAQILRATTKNGIPTGDVTQIYSSDGSTIKSMTVGMTYNNYMLAGSLYDKTLLCQIVHA